jgi:hypothetical protein
MEAFRQALEVLPCFCEIEAVGVGLGRWGDVVVDYQQGDDQGEVYGSGEYCHRPRRERQRVGFVGSHGPVLLEGMGEVTVGERCGGSLVVLLLRYVCKLLYQVRLRGPAWSVSAICAFHYYCCGLVIALTEI